MTGYHDYLIVLTPPANVVERVKTLKDRSANLIGEFGSRHSKANITIQNWPRKKPVWIDPLIPKLQRELLSLPALFIDVDGFDYFLLGNNATIYLRIVQSPSSAIWFRQLKRFFARSKITPHITIARNISKTDFDSLWPRFKKIEWKEKIRIEKLTLLRREMIGHDRSFQLFKELPFNNKIDFNAYINLKQRLPAADVKPKNDDQFSLF